MESANTVRVYGCGGAGVNIASGYEKANKDTKDDVEVSYIDTSRSNLTTDVKDNQVFILDNVDGSGKVRAENHQEIANVTKKILLQFEPAQMNLVLFSGSGGSGSVLGPLIVSELLSKGENVIAMVVGSQESVITAQNTMNTLKSLESVSKSKDKPVVMFYQQNDRKRSEVNEVFELGISSIAILSSRKNKELDSKDISNLLYFNKTTSVSSQLAYLDIYNDLAQANSVEDPIAVASLYKNEDMEHLSTIPEYSCVGYFPDSVNGIENLHYIINVETIPKIVKQLKTTLDKYENQKASRVQQASLLNESDNVTDSGLIL